MIQVRPHRREKRPTQYVDLRDVDSLHVNDYFSLSDRSEIVRGDGTPLELFLGGIRSLTLHLSIVDIEAACGKQP